jgi:hypothetical protein
MGARQPAAPAASRDAGIARGESPASAVRRGGLPRIPALVADADGGDRVAAIDASSGLEARRYRRCPFPSHCARRWPMLFLGVTLVILLLPKVLGIGLAMFSRPSGLRRNAPARCERRDRDAVLRIDRPPDDGLPQPVRGGRGVGAERDLGRAAARGQGGRLGTKPGAVPGASCLPPDPGVCFWRGSRRHSSGG